MKNNNPVLTTLSCGAISVLFAVCLLASPVMAKKAEPPETTTDGLTLTKKTRSRYVYTADGADISKYTKVYIVDCAVAFKENWQRDYNRNVSMMSQRVDDKDVERMKAGLAEEFKKVFTEVMTENGHEVVTEAGPDVLILRPALINVVVNAPDVQSASMSRTYVADAGEMTLYLELYDSVSGAIIARILDAQDDGRTAPSISYANKVTNIAAADRMLKRWARELAKHMGEVQAEATE